MTLPERTGRRVFSAFAGARAPAVARACARRWPRTRRRCSGSTRDDERVRLSTREAFDLYARYWFDTFRIREMPDAEVNARTVAEGFHNIDAALERWPRRASASCPTWGTGISPGTTSRSTAIRSPSVAEELRPGAALRAVPASPRGARDADHPAREGRPRRPAAQAAARRELGRRAGRRPRPRRARRRGRDVRRAPPGPRGPRAARR